MKAAHDARLEGKTARAELPPARKMEKMRLWFERNKGIPRKGDTSPGFDMGAFWNRLLLGALTHRELFAAALSKSPRMKAAHDARLEGKAAPAQKMEKMRLWFEQNEGIPPRGDTSPGFDMGAFWGNCCSGANNGALRRRALEVAQDEGRRARAAASARPRAQLGSGAAPPGPAATRAMTRDATRARGTASGARRAPLTSAGWFDARSSTMRAPSSGLRTAPSAAGSTRTSRTSRTSAARPPRCTVSSSRTGRSRATRRTSRCTSCSNRWRTIRGRTRRARQAQAQAGRARARVEASPPARVVLRDDACEVNAGDDGIPDARAEATWIDGIPVWSRPCHDLVC